MLLDFFLFLSEFLRGQLLGHVLVGFLVDFVIELFKGRLWVLYLCVLAAMLVILCDFVLVEMHHRHALAFFHHLKF